MERQIQRVGIALVLAFGAIFLQLNYVQIFAAERIAENPANRLQLIREYAIKRGDILTLDGEIMARSKATKGLYKYRRLYPGGELYGHITGWYSVRYGLDRLERTYRDQLLGEGGVLSMQDIQDRFLGSGEQGDDVRTTIQSRLQQVARDALGNRTEAPSWRSIRTPAKCGRCGATRRSIRPLLRRSTAKNRSATGSHSTRSRPRARS